MKRILKILSLIILLLIVLSAVWFFVNKKPNNQIILDKNEQFFYHKLEEFKKSGKNSIELKSLTNFEWNQICVVNPYGGIDLQHLKKFNLNKPLPNENEEGKLAIVFFNTNDLTGKVILVYSLDYDLKIESGNNSCFTDDNVILKILNSDHKIILLTK